MFSPPRTMTSSARPSRNTYPASVDPAAVASPEPAIGVELAAGFAVFAGHLCAANEDEPEPTCSRARPRLVPDLNSTAGSGRPTEPSRARTSGSSLAKAAR
jgi:hypothetical protein